MQKWKSFLRLFCCCTARRVAARQALLLTPPVYPYLLCGLNSSSNLVTHNSGGRRMDDCFFKGYRIHNIHMTIWAVSAGSLRVYVLGVA